MEYRKPIMNRKRTYHWCSVGGNPLEPCAVDYDPVSDNIRKAYTCGCPDPFDLLDPNCPLKLYTVRGKDDPIWGTLREQEDKMAVRPPTLPEHMGGEKPLPSRSHGWRPPYDPPQSTPKREGVG